LFDFYQETGADPQEECSSSDPEVEYTTDSDMPGNMTNYLHVSLCLYTLWDPGSHSSAISGGMEQDLQHIHNSYNALQEMVHVLVLYFNFNFLLEDLHLAVL
jgi:hypothetical protein